jgi:hypothetical protein
MDTTATTQWPYIIGGVITGLFGWLLYWAGIPIVGGIIGATAGGALGMIACDLLQSQANVLLFVGAGALLGAVPGVLLMRAIQRYFFFAAGAILGGALVWRFLYFGTSLAETQANWSIAGVILLAALVGGVLVSVFRKFLVALATSALGTTLLMYGLPQQYKLLGGLVALVIFFSVQIGLVSHFVEQEHFDQRMKRRARRAEDEDE